MQRADKRKFHYIYKITRDDGRFYIGMHSTDSLEDGYFGSGKRITRSIKKHGKDRHRKEILELLPSREALKLREKEMITDDLRTDSMCMNIAPGGGGGLINDEHKQAWLSAMLVGRAKFNEKLQSDAEFATAYRQVQSAKMKQQNTDGLMNSQRFSGKTHTVESKAKTSASMKDKQAGTRNSQFGTCWVTDGLKPAKIQKNELETYLSNGYVRGRTIGS